MTGHYFHLALRSFRRNKVLTALMVLAIALGIGACMTTMTVFHVLSGDPMPGSSQMLFHPQLDVEGTEGYVPGGEPERQLTRLDAETLLRDRRGDLQAMMSGGMASVTPPDAAIAPFLSDARYTTADMFAMFRMPLAQGNAWSAADDEARARVVVLSQEMNRKLFGDADSVGRLLRLNETDFRVIGVLGAWRPAPKFYDVWGSRGYDDIEGLFLPFSTAQELKMGHNGSMNCWGETDGDPKKSGAPCAWIQYWVQLDSPAKVEAYRRYLEQYSDQQRAAGRYERPTNVRLRDVMQWLDLNQIVPHDALLQLWLAVGFLFVCLLNTIGLLLAKFLRRGGEIGVRRALGATRGAIFRQYMVEAGTVGLAGALLGLGFAMLGLWAVRQQPVDYAELARLDAPMLLLTFVLALASSLLAGALPAWRAMQITPAVQLKAQ